LNAKGFLVSVNGQPVDLRFRAFDLAVEEHPRYTFHLNAPLPDRGTLTIQDTNFVASEGTSRLAIRSLDGVAVLGDELPGDVREVPIRPVWQLTDDEERRTRQVAVRFEPAGAKAPAPEDTAAVASRPAARPRPSNPLSRLLDRATGLPTIGLWLVALALGAAHAIQPGHGKALVAAAAVGERGGRARGALLALILTAAHMGGVLVVAAALWATRSSRYAEIDRGLARTAGFLIASIGLWRLGRHLAGFGEHGADDPSPADLGARGLIGLGLAGGLVPCWDAVVLIVLAAAVGRLGLGLMLLTGFSLGMASVLVAVGLLAARLRRFVALRDAEGRWERRLGLLGAGTLTAIGLYLLVI
jgi:ABC-type nickel/cobalt efflux system permease component RcnA